MDDLKPLSNFKVKDIVYAPYSKLTYQILTPIFETVTTTVKKKTKTENILVKYKLKCLETNEEFETTINTLNIFTLKSNG